MESLKTCWILYFLQDKYTKDNQHDMFLHAEKGVNSILSNTRQINSDSSPLGILGSTVDRALSISGTSNSRWYTLRCNQCPLVTKVSGELQVDTIRWCHSLTAASA